MLSCSLHCPHCLLQAFLTKTGDVLGDQGPFDPRLVVQNGSKVVTIGTQTPGEYAEQQAQQQAEQDAAGNVSNHNLAALYHGSWPIDKQGGSRLTDTK